MGRKLLLLNITINPVGAFLTFLYFRYISPGFHGEPEMSHAQSYLIFAIGTGAVICIFYWFIRRWTDPLIRVVEGKTSMDALDSISAPRLKRRAIQFAPFIAVTNFVAWIFAGFIFGFLEPVFSQVFLGAAPRNLIECLRVFFGITVIGGTIAALVIYFTAENMWRKVLPRFFPEGDLSQVKDAFKLSVKMRLIVVFLAISLFPLPLLGAAAYTKAQAMHTADAITRTQIMSSLLLEVIFIQPHKTPDSRLEMQRQPGGLKQVYACSLRKPPAPAGGVSLRSFVWPPLCYCPSSWPKAFPTP